MWLTQTHLCVTDLLLLKFQSHRTQKINVQERLLMSSSDSSTRMTKVLCITNSKKAWMRTARFRLPSRKNMLMMKSFTQYALYMTLKDQQTSSHLCKRSRKPSNSKMALSPQSKSFLRTKIWLATRWSITWHHGFMSFQQRLLRSTVWGNLDSVNSDLLILSHFEFIYHLIINKFIFL